MMNSQAAKASPRWALLTATSTIWSVGSAHRGEAFAACEFIMDYLKTQAPFWKREVTAEGARWVDARAADDQAAERWRRPDR